VAGGQIGAKALPDVSFAGSLQIRRISSLLWGLFYDLDFGINIVLPELAGLLFLTSNIGESFPDGLAEIFFLMS
jgi:hypothetical protein